MQNTQIIFIVKNEPILDSIEKEFKNHTYQVKHIPGNNGYSSIIVNVDKVIPGNKDNIIILDSYPTLYESLRHY